MCAIFGVLDYQEKLSPAQRLALFQALADAAQMRGTDASGVAYVHNGAVQIQKAPRPACKMRWRISPQARYLMGHTRMTTQGAACQNYNNHPFPGKAGGLPFALAHNGVIYNDTELRRGHRLPPSRIETDSYVAVQLLEQAGELSMDSLRQMAEALQGTFTITVLDAANTLYFVRGDNPLAIRLFPQLGCYLYASTEEILNMVLAALGLSGLAYTDIPSGQGDILSIDAGGRRANARFDDAKLRPQRYFFDWGWHKPAGKPERDDYLETVIEYGKRRGVPEGELRLLMDAGYDALDLEEMIYDDHFRAYCLREITEEFGVR